MARQVLSRSYSRGNRRRMATTTNEEEVTHHGSQEVRPEGSQERHAREGDAEELSAQRPQGAARDQPHRADRDRNVVAESAKVVPIPKNPALVNLNLSVKTLLVSKSPARVPQARSPSGVEEA